VSGDEKRIADLEPAAGRLTRRELEDGVRTAPGGGAPGAKLVRDPEHPQPSVEEDGVDREAHETGVDRRRRAKEQSLARPQLAASEQSPQTGNGRVGDDALVDHDLAVLPSEGDLFHV
jgi:hypothetical protein